MAKARKVGGVNAIIGANVGRLRRAMDITQEELAEVAGYHRTYVGMIERGEKNITIAVLEALAGALKVDAHELLLPE